MTAGIYSGQIGYNCEEYRLQEESYRKRIDDFKAWIGEQDDKRLIRWIKDEAMSMNISL